MPGSDDLMGDKQSGLDLDQAVKKFSLKGLTTIFSCLMFSLSNRVVPMPPKGSTIIYSAPALGISFSQCCGGCKEAQVSSLFFFKCIKQEATNCKKIIIVFIITILDGLDGPDLVIILDFHFPHPSMRKSVGSVFKISQILPPVTISMLPLWSKPSLSLTWITIMPS